MQKASRGPICSRLRSGPQPTTGTWVAPKAWPANDSWLALMANPSAVADTHYLAAPEAPAGGAETEEAATVSKRSKKGKTREEKRRLLEKASTPRQEERYYLVRKAAAAKKYCDRLSLKTRHTLLRFYNARVVVLLRVVAAVAILVLALGTQLRPKDLPKGIRAARKKHLSKETRGWLRKHDYSRKFIDYSWQMAEAMSSPSIMFKAKLRNGQEIIVDDYREAYWWLRDNTPEDARVMAWWDYGYQISGIGNRTTIADGNTWNHEHIATLGKALTSNQEKAHKIVRHLADYLLVWTGGGGDDLAKSPHMARIGNSVYRDICPDDPTCSTFGFYSRGQPTPMMRASLLYNLHGHNQVPGVQVNPKLYEEAFTSKYHKVRIFRVLKVSQKSKKWIADPENRVCDAPGSWYCSGQYPPALKRLIDSRRDFSQLENFNKGGADKEYTEAYMARMEGRDPKAEGKKEKTSKAKAKPSAKKSKKSKKAQLVRDGCIWAGVSYKGPNIDRMTTEGSVECMERCNDDFACSGWSFKKESKICRLKGSESAGNIVLKTGYVSGGAQCSDEDLAVVQRLRNAAKEEKAAAAARAEDAEEEKKAAAARAKKAEQKKQPKEVEPEPVASSSSEAADVEWANSPDTTRMWGLVNNGDVDSLEDWIEEYPGVVHIRAEDGRGPLWWAYEYGQYDVVQLLLESGANSELEDKDGKKPAEM